MLRDPRIPLLFGALIVILIAAGCDPGVQPSDVEDALGADTADTSDLMDPDAPDTPAAQGPITPRGRAAGATRGGTEDEGAQGARGDRRPHEEIPTRSPRGLPCGEDVDCDAGLVCNGARRGALPGGRCLPPGEPGDPCEEAQDCTAPLWCSAGSGGLTCVVPKRAEGQACSGQDTCSSGLHCVGLGVSGVCVDGSAGSPCSDSGDCDWGLACNATLVSAAGGTCAEPGVEGAPCAEADDCETTLLCVSDLTGGADSCALPVADGDACAPTLGCGGGSKCVASTGGHVCSSGLEGAPCTTDDGCSAGFVCLAPPGEKGFSCWAPRPEGGPCVVVAHCAADLVCLVASGEKLGVCKVPSLEDGPCATPEHCAAGLTCSFDSGGPGSSGGALGVCVPLGPAGSPCITTGDCVPDLACTSYFGPKLCGPPLLTSCNGDADCAAGLSCHFSLGGIDGSCTQWEPTYCLEWDSYESGSWCDGYQSYCTYWEGDTIESQCGQCALAVGSVALGDLCGLDGDCAEGLFCQAAEEVHRCAPQQGVDGVCSDTTECLPGTWCSGGVCKARTPLLGSCASTSQCDVGLNCSSGLCVKPLLKKCTADESCGAGMACVVTMGGVNGDCQEYDDIEIYDDCYECPTLTYGLIPVACGQCLPEPGTLIPGEPCHHTADCEPGLVCTSDKKCAPPGLAGAHCVMDTECVDGAVCVIGICAAPGQAGAPCKKVADCTVGLLCIVGECAPVGNVGAACGVHADCVTPLVCGVGDDGKTCGPPRGAGEPCGSAAECVVGLLCASFGQCSDAGADGAKCGADSDCVAGLECTGTAQVLGTCGPTSGEFGSPCLESEDCVTWLCTGGICTYWCD